MFRKNILTALILSGCWLTAQAASNGYGVETPTADNTGSNYPNTNNQQNPYINYDNYTLLDPTVTGQSVTPVTSDVGFETSSYQSQLNSEWLSSPTAHNYEGNNLASTPEDRSSISATGDKASIVFYKNYANYIALQAENGAKLLVDGNTAAGANITNDSAYILLKNNYADDATIINNNHGVMLIDGNAVNGANMTNDNAYMDVYHNTAIGVKINNFNGATFTALGNNISDGEINNSVDSIFKIGDCNSNVCSDTVGTSAKNVTLINDGLFLMSGNIDLSNSTVTNSGKLSGAVNTLNLTGSDIRNSGMLDLSGDINMANSSVKNQGLFTLANANVLMNNTVIDNGGTLAISDAYITKGILNNSGSIMLSNTIKSSTDVNNKGLLTVNSHASVDLMNSHFTNLSAGKINLQNDTDITGNITNRGFITLDSAGDTPVYSTLHGTLDNYGTLQLASTDSKSGNTLTIDGDYAGYSGSWLVMNSVLNDDSSSSDKLLITGDSRGESAISITNVGGHGAQTVEGINIITIEGNSGANFTQDGRIVAGAYDYTLTKANNGNWYLTSKDNTPVTPTEPVEPEKPTEPVEPEKPTEPVEPEKPTEPVAPEKPTEPVAPEKPTEPVEPEKPTEPVEPEKPTEPVKPLDPVPPVIPEKPTDPATPAQGVSRERPEAGSYIANIAAANTLFTTRLADRRGETHYRDPVTGEMETTSLWMRNEGGHNRWHSSSGQLKTQSNRYILQLGSDLGQWTLNGADSVTMGAMAGYASDKSKTHSSLTGYDSRGNTNGYSAGLYGTWYADKETKAGAYVDSWMLYNWFDNAVKGDNLSEESYRSKGITASIETGYSAKISEFISTSGMPIDWYIQPQAQVIWMGVRSKKHTESNGTRVSSEGDGNVQTRLGLKTYLSSRASQDAKRDRLFQPYVEANWIHNTDTFAVKMDDRSVRQDGARNVGEMRVGLDSTVATNLNLWGNVGIKVGDHNYSDSTVMLGIKYGF